MSHFGKWGIENFGQTTWGGIELHEPDPPAPPVVIDDAAPPKITLAPRTGGRTEILAERFRDFRDVTTVVRSVDSTTELSGVIRKTRRGIPNSIKR